MSMECLAHGESCLRCTVSLNNEIRDLRNRIEDERTRSAVLVKALEDIKRHHEYIAGTTNVRSTVISIAEKALVEYRKGI